MGKKPIVKLRVYRGKQMTYNKDGSVQNENQLISVEHKSTQWKLTMKTLPIMGYCEVGVDHILEDKDGEWIKKNKDIESYSKEVAEAYSPKSTAPKTADQLRIEQLEAQNKEMLAKFDALMKGKPVDKEVVNEEESEHRLKELKLEYFKLFGKEPHHNKKEERLIEEIDEFKNQQ
tara:strand:+ start:470 stop:994 length:525 start_codon:yes stop_codon:yes gene_type:complete